MVIGLLRGTPHKEQHEHDAKPRRCCTNCTPNGAVSGLFRKQVSGRRSPRLQVQQVAFRLRVLCQSEHIPSPPSCACTMRSSQSLPNMPSLPPAQRKHETFSRLETLCDIFQHRQAAIVIPDRLSVPLPLDVEPLNSLMLSREPLHTRMGAEATPHNLTTIAASPLPSPLIAAKRQDGTLSSLGLGARMLVAFGGRDARHGELLPAEPMVCDAVLRRWSVAGASSSREIIPPKEAAIDDGPLDGFGAGDDDDEDALGGGGSLDGGRTPCARASHAAAVLGHAQTLLAVVGGEDGRGELLGDLCLLEMRSIENAEMAERRRQVRAQRAPLFGKLVALRAKQGTLRASLERARDLASEAEELLDDDDALAAIDSDGKAELQALSALRGEVARLKKSLRELDAHVAAQLQSMSDDAGASGVTWRWLRVEMIGIGKGLGIGGKGSPTLTPRRRHACAARHGELWVFGGEVRADNGPPPAATAGPAAADDVEAAPPAATSSGGHPSPGAPSPGGGGPREKEKVSTSTSPHALDSMRRSSREPSKPHSPGVFAAALLAEATRIEEMHDDEILEEIERARVMERDHDPEDVSAAELAALMRKHAAIAPTPAPLERKSSSRSSYSGGGSNRSLPSGSMRNMPTAEAATRHPPAGAPNSTPLTLRRRQVLQRRREAPRALPALQPTHHPSAPAEEDAAVRIEDAAANGAAADAADGGVAGGMDGAPAVAIDDDDADGGWTSPPTARPPSTAPPPSGAPADAGTTDPEAPILVPTGELLCATLHRERPPAGSRASAPPVVKVRWRRVRTSGRAPPARFAHGMCMTSQGLLVVHGGVGLHHGVELAGSGAAVLKMRASQYQPKRIGKQKLVLSDVHVLDTTRGHWSQPELSGWPSAKRAFHCLHSLDGRLLCFGGVNGKGAPVADVATVALTARTLAGGDGFWCHPRLEAGAADDLQRARGGSCVVHGRLLVLGGATDPDDAACNELLTVDAGATALYSVTPSRAMVTGGVPMELAGRAFPLAAAGDAYVRFTWRDTQKGTDAGGPPDPIAQRASGGLAHAEVRAVVHNAERATCVSPAVDDRLAEGEVAVSMVFALHGRGRSAPQSLQTEAVDMLLLGETAAGECVLAGAGATSAVAGATTAMHVLACNASGLRRKHGGDLMHLEVEDIKADGDANGDTDGHDEDSDDQMAAAIGGSRPPPPPPPPSPKPQATAPERRGPIVGTVTDQRNGRYGVTYLAPTMCGVYQLALTVNGEPGPTQPVRVTPGPAHSLMLTGAMSPASNAEAGEPLCLYVFPRDAYGNLCALKPSKLEVTLLEPTPPPLVPTAGVVEGFPGAAETALAGHVTFFTAEEAAAAAVVQVATKRSREVGARRLRMQPQATLNGPLLCDVDPERAGSYLVSLNLRGSVAQEDMAVRFDVAPGPTSPVHCILVERAGERGLCKSAAPPRESLSPNAAGHDLSLVVRDRFGNPRTVGGDRVEVELRFTLYSGSSKMAQTLKAKLAPLDPKPPTVVDRGDGSYAVHLPGIRPCRAPKPAVTPCHEEDLPEKLAPARWMGKIVRLHESDNTHGDGLALVEDVTGGHITVRWVQTGESERGTPTTVLGVIDDDTFVSDWLKGPVDAENLGALEVLGLDCDQTSGASELSYLVASREGEEPFRMPVHQLLRAIEQRRGTIRASKLQEPLTGEYTLAVSVNGQRSVSERLSIFNPFTRTARPRSQVASKGLDWQRDWRLVEQSLRARGMDVHPCLQAVLIPYVPLLQDLYIQISDRRAETEDEVDAEGNEDVEDEPPVTDGDIGEGSAANDGAEEHIAPPSLMKRNAFAISTLSGGAGDEESPSAASVDGPASAPEEGDGKSAPIWITRDGDANEAATSATTTYAASSSADEAKGKKSKGKKKKKAAKGPKGGADAPVIITKEDWWDMGKQLQFTQSGDKHSDTPSLTQAQIDEMLPQHAKAALGLLPNQAGRASPASGEGWSLAGGEGSAGGMDFSSMMEGLLMVGARKYGKALAPAAMERLLEDCVKQFGADGNGMPVDDFDDELREELRRTKEMRTCLRRLDKKLRELYRFWSASDGQDQRADMVSCKELIQLLQKASIIGNRLSVVNVKAFCMLTLFSTRTAVFGVEHENEHLVFGDFVEVLTRCAVEYFKASKVVTELDDRLTLLVEHCHQTTYVALQLNDLKDPKRAELTKMNEAQKEKEKQAARKSAIASRHSSLTPSPTAATIVT